MRRRPSNPGQRPFMLSGDALKRIAAAVQSYEHGDRKQSPIKFRTAGWDDVEYVRLGRISADWTHGESATVERLDENGDPFDPPSTFTATNYSNTVYVPSGEERHVACGLVGETWILIEAERGCGTAADARELDAYADTGSSLSQLLEGEGAEVLLNTEGCATWFKVTKKTVVVDVRFEGEPPELVKDLKDVWLLEDAESLTTETIVGTTECPPPEPPPE